MAPKLIMPESWERLLTAGDVVKGMMNTEDCPRTWPAVVSEKRIAIIVAPLTDNPHTRAYFEGILSNNIQQCIDTLVQSVLEIPVFREDSDDESVGEQDEASESE
jgi:hypothetical protein